MSKILQGLPAAAHDLMNTLSHTLLKYEPRLAELSVQLLSQTRPGHLGYSLHARLHCGAHATFGATLAREGRVLIRHLKQCDYLAR